MALLARGSVTDRPWGLTFGALGVRGLTGELAVVADGKTYRVAFDQGAIVAAHSPLASDAAVRIALTANLITSTQVSDITRRMAATPQRDELDMLAEYARLGPDQAQRLRRRLVAHRAARAASLDRGDFTVEDGFTLPVVPGNELDVRAVCYLATKNNFAEERMGSELAALGGRFKLKEEAVGDLAQYGFTELEKPVLEMLLEGADLVDVEAANPSLGARGVRAIVYALVSCAACEIRSSTQAVRSVRSSPPTTPPPRAHGHTSQPVRAPAASPPSQPVAARPPPAPAPSRVPPSPAPPIDAAPPVRMRTPTGQPPMQTAPLREQRPSTAAAPRRAKRNTAATQEIDQLLAHKLPLLDQGVDHFTLLGLSQHASAEEIRQTYFMLARKLHPDRLSAIGVVDEARNAQRLMAQINAAFAVLDDAAKRSEYVAILERGGESAVREQEAQADEMAMRIMRAEEAFRQGEMALRRDQLPQAVAAFQNAVDLQPNESEYQALLAWAQFASAADKNAVAAQTRRALLKAAEANDRSLTARFYLGRVERMLGKEREALQHFQDVLRIKPSHGEAASEARVLEQRLKGKR